MKHPLDQRKARYQPDHEAAGALAEGREAWLEQHFRAARYFQRMSHNAAFFGEGCGSLGQLADLLGYDGTQARDLACLGYALEGCAGLEAAIRDRTVVLANAVEVGKIYERPELVLDTDDWLNKARVTRLG